MYTRVTVALDGSRLAEGALGPARTLAREHGASLRVVSVAGSHRDEAHLKAYHQALYEDGVFDHDVACEVLVDEGLGIPAALDRALEDPDELLCLATRAHGAIGSLVLGSVTEGVVARHRSPLLTVGPGYGGDRPAAFHTLLVCLDGSCRSESILPFAAAWAGAHQMSVLLLHVAPLPRPPEAEIPPGREHVAEERDRQAQQATAAYLKERTTALAAEGVPTTWEILRRDNPAAAICDRAGRLPDSIVAIASRGHGGARRLTMGSVAMQVAHDSPVPLLVVRSRPQDEAVR